MAFTIKSEIVINAAPEKVWAIMDDTAKYPEWNVFMPAIETNKKVGDPAVLYVQWIGSKKPFKQPEKITAWDSGKRMGWGIVYLSPLILEANRIQEISAVEGGKTHYISHETLRGFASWLIKWLYSSKIQAGFDTTARLLKERAERG